MVFRGINNATLDAKGRMALPSRFREPVLALAAGKTVVTIDVQEPCLLLYPLPEWDVVQSQLESLDNVSQKARMVQRLLIGHATDLELDGNGRILLPSSLREFGGLEKHLKLVGQGNKIEIWAKEAWSDGMSRWMQSDLLGELGSGGELSGLKL